MKRVILTVICLIIVFVVPIVGVSLYAANIPDVYGRTYLAAMADKYKILHDTDGEKIVLVGGSSMAFGIDSAAIERELGMPVVNMGLYAALGSKTTLDLTRSGISKGDIVVFAPEMDKQAYSMYTNSEITVQVLEANRSMIWQIPVSEWAGLFCELPDYITAKKSLNKNGVPDPTNAYSRAAFNEYGDNVYDRPYNIMPDLYLPANMIDINIDMIDGEFIEFVNDYAASVRKAGARFCFSFPPMNGAAFTADSVYEKRLEVYEKLREKLECEIIGNIEDHIMSEGYFYDSNYHLNNSGVPYNTKILIGDLKRLLGDDSVTDIEILPPSGAEHDDDETVGDDTDSDLYEYEDDIGGWAIVAVKPEAKDKDVLRVPRSYNGKKVYKIKRGAFGGSSAHTIEIGDNITALDDGIFADCANLKTVYLSVKLGANDGLPSVGGDLFSGANRDVLIYVPSIKYGAMCTDYFWMQYSERLRVAK